MAQWPNRRKYLATLGALGVTGIAGCSQGDSTTESTQTETPTSNLGGANFTFEYDTQAQQITIEYTGGATIQAGNLQVRASTGQQTRWSQLGSTTTGSDAQLSSGATAVLGAGVLNWGAGVDPSETIRLVFAAGNGPSTLGRFTPTEPSTLTSTPSGEEFSIELATEGEVHFSETVTFDNVSTELPDLIVGMSKTGDDGCAESTYEAQITDMTITDGSTSYDIADNVPISEFSRSDTRREVYSNPVSGSDTWTWSFNIEPQGPVFSHPDHWHCAAHLRIYLTQDGDWFEDPNEWGPPENAIAYNLQRQQPGTSNESGSLSHGAIITNESGEQNRELLRTVDDASNDRDYDFYQEDVIWNITVERR
ncbi:hypothetical protein [Haloarcula sediminis]|uniref:hypothetical protein n=1 Tax=Haloarcula sediminis TaxID=3111777 RepID=UPI002D792A9E|nr:hypothetical protein [Haloarcula sp. CK38]